MNLLRCFPGWTYSGTEVVGAIFASDVTYVGPDHGLVSELVILNH